MNNARKQTISGMLRQNKMKEMKEKEEKKQPNIKFL